MQPLKIRGNCEVWWRNVGDNGKYSLAKVVILYIFVLRTGDPATTFEANVVGSSLRYTSKNRIHHLRKAISSVISNISPTNFGILHTLKCCMSRIYIVFVLPGSKLSSLRELPIVFDAERFDTPVYTAKNERPVLA